MVVMFNVYGIVVLDRNKYVLMFFYRKFNFVVMVKVVIVLF